MKKKEKDKKCPICGGYSPNTYGECLCSYDPIMLSGDYKKITKILAKHLRQVLNLVNRIK